MAAKKTAKKTAASPRVDAFDDVLFTRAEKRALRNTPVGPIIKASVERDSTWINLLQCALLAAKVQSPYKEDHHVLEAILDAMLERQRGHVDTHVKRNNAGTSEEAYQIKEPPLDGQLVTWARGYLKKRDIAQKRKPRNLKSVRLTCVRELMAEIEWALNHASEHKAWPRDARDMVASTAVAYLSLPATTIRPDREERETAKARVYEALRAEQSDWMPPRETPEPNGKRTAAQVDQGGRALKHSSRFVEKIAKLILREWTLKPTKVVEGWFKAS